MSCPRHVCGPREIDYGGCRSQRDAVRAIIEANPGIQGLCGAHGITLLAHARAGEADAIPVVEYFLKLGGADVAQAGTPVPEPERAAIIGTYAFGIREDERLKVYMRKGDPAIKRGNAALHVSRRA